MSDTWQIEPSAPLRGDIQVNGAKNSATKHMVAAMLAGTPSKIRNVPDVGDVAITSEILRKLGVGVERDGGDLTITPTAEPVSHLETRFSGLNRIPILLIGPLLNRTGEAFVPLVGGDRIGARPVDFHVMALQALGAEVSVTPEGIHAKARRLKGTRIELPYSSVGATESILLSAVLAEGTTVIRNAAIEPEIIELALFLQRMGAGIELQPDRCMIIHGVDQLKGAATTLQGDRIEAFSYLVAGLLTGGHVRVLGCAQDRLVTAINTLQRMGAIFDITDNYISAHAPRGLRAVAVKTDTHPGFMTDWQTPLLVLMTQAEGLSVLHETVFENRLVYVDALKSFGCEMEVFSACLGGRACRFHDTDYPHSVVVRGRSQLRGADVEVPDVRAGFSSVLAAAIADAPSILRGVRHLERGYESPAERLRSIGLKVTPIPEN
ncbi:MAG TPA: UDP-N-acetylglucosamine 1-carboxyvinyltransferase [Trebonia sp.]